MTSQVESEEPREIERRGSVEGRARTVQQGTGRAQPDLERARGVGLRTHTLVLLGDLNHGSASVLEAEIDRVSSGEVDWLVLDLRALTTIDAVGARVILLRSRLCRARGMHLELIRGSSTIQEVFDAAGLTEELRFRDPPESAEPDPMSARQRPQSPNRERTVMR
jgi:anti-anti-sigma factor